MDTYILYVYFTIKLFIYTQEIICIIFINGKRKTERISMNSFFILAFWTHLHVYVMQRDIYIDMLCMQSKKCMIQNICVLFTTDDGMHEKHVLLLLLLLWSYLWNLTCPVSIHMYIPGIYTHILVSPCVSKHFFFQFLPFTLQSKIQANMHFFSVLFCFFFSSFIYQPDYITHSDENPDLLGHLDYVSHIT